MDELSDADDSQGRTGACFFHRPTLTIGYRNFSSEFYFIGTHEIPSSPAVENHQNIWDVDVDFRLSHRRSLIADVPAFQGSRNQIDPPSGVFQVAGIGDMTIGSQMWLFRPPTEMTAISFSACH